ncbi:Hypothetical protein CINCED_3A013938 [Cinara cedri]|uniref:Uncharacterized protein n=1 Tax=Cinara cedri TaxID=506608 RepID=A0A5E4MLT1_9HEMI|nr:Hypothetical protein CINCED_3A013938 [Cinara cedri]
MSMLCYGGVECGEHGGVFNPLKFEHTHVRQGRTDTENDQRFQSASRRCQHGDRVVSAIRPTVYGRQFIYLAACFTLDSNPEHRTFSQSFRLTETCVCARVNEDRVIVAL